MENTANVLCNGRKNEKGFLSYYLLEAIQNMALIA